MDSISAQILLKFPNRCHFRNINFKNKKNPQFLKITKIAPQFVKKFPNKIPNFGRKQKFWSKIQILVKNPNFGQKSKLKKSHRKSLKISKNYKKFSFLKLQKSFIISKNIENFKNFKNYFVLNCEIHFYCKNPLFSTISIFLFKIFIKIFFYRILTKKNDFLAHCFHSLKWYFCGFF